MFEFSVLIDELVESNRLRRKHPLADPLDGPEWQGLHWLVRLFEKSRPETPAKSEHTRSNAWAACVQPAKGQAIA
ncbi:hypothetical protein SAMN04488498_11384 [Mesorhizobium albiziae]|uniref:Uncharacterized protein n=1 Tax=Neomesorhizobium albiziae TaxID=335020 RepID=A0A1I4CIA8_9HYPH|nr:hypothetical protein [Mesorhizobium albiziae]GLS29281.1 hypothetical protein GCM10007937_09890 [Mesorhizobium albiziae]SFK80982.1 hypothetical protein SAMN04488498_11384 [Mesorhizobium albiziae]